MSPAEAAIREALREAQAIGMQQGIAAFAPIGALASLLSELDALRARCEAAEALLREVRIIVPEQYETRDRIDAHLKGAGRE